MSPLPRLHNRGLWSLVVGLFLCAAVYWPGLAGAYLFDDYPNIVDNANVHITDAHIASLVRAALSSPSSEFKRPLASLTFAMNYLVAGLAPFGWKLTNLVIHLLNGLLVYLLAKSLFRAMGVTGTGRSDRSGVVAALIAGGWMVLPINLTGVLYVVQRMESLANLFVLAGLLGYVAGRLRMMGGRPGLWICAGSLVLPVAVGVLAKETAVMLPLYAFLIEWIVFGFTRTGPSPGEGRKHPGLVALFAIVLVLPMLAGLMWLVPGLLKASAWATRDFTLGQRLLSEARIVVDYIGWTLVPTPGALSFYHDDFRVSTGLLKPWTTLASLLVLCMLVALVLTTRRRYPLLALGTALYLGSHLLTGTILPLELIYEHRNYFASFGLLLAVVPLLAAPGREHRKEGATTGATGILGPLPMSLPRYVALGGLMLFWLGGTALTAYAWGDPLRLAEDLASRAPESPRAQYELGRAYIIYSHYDPASPFTRLAYGPLEQAMRLPNSSILPEQALIFMNSRMGLPIKDAWWRSMASKLAGKDPGVQDESSLAALVQCARVGSCPLPKDRMIQVFLAALGHPRPSARLLATYSDYAWNILHERDLALRMAQQAATSAPKEPAYSVTLARMLIAEGKLSEAGQTIRHLENLNVGGRLDNVIGPLRAALSQAHQARPS